MALAKKTVFLDRDGTLIEERCYLSDPVGVKLEREVAPALAQLCSVGFQLLVVTNQSGLARGYFNVNDLLSVNARVHALLAARGVVIAGWYYCPHAPGDACACRKPAPGLLEQAAVDFPVDWARSFFIGDSRSDASAALAKGIAPILLATGKGAGLGNWAAERGVPWLPDMSAAKDFILARENK